MNQSDITPRWIGYYGRRSEPVLITAYTEDAALDIVTKLSMDDGCLDDDLVDTTWVVPYDRDTAEEEGLEAPNEVPCVQG